MDHPEFKTIITVEGVSELKVEDAVNDLLQSLPLKAVLRYSILCYVVLRYVKAFYVMLCYVMLCYACYVTLCSVVLC